MTHEAGAERSRPTGEQAATRPAEPRARIAGSFRDPAGFVFVSDGEVYRQVNRCSREDYDLLMQSGLYAALVHEGWLIPHVEVSLDRAFDGEAYRVLKPAQVPFTSYPYEWCFSQLKAAAQVTLQVQAKALEFGMGLKDASAYNIQFFEGRPVLIDTLSLERYQEGAPWVAYGQFCRHLLAPLALAACVDVRLLQLLRVHLDGIPLDLAAALLPLHTRFHGGLLSHLHLHAGAQEHFKGERLSRQLKMGRTPLLGLVDNLRSTVQDLEWRPTGGDWKDYASFSNYSAAAWEDKKRIVGEMLDGVAPAPRTVWDLGANVGLFSRLASARGAYTCAFDLDPAAVEMDYVACVAEGETRLLPLWLDLTNPSPGLGWEHRERMSLEQRGPADLILALALVHHLAITNHASFAQVAGFLSRIGRALIVEFVPKEDSQIQLMLANREDIFADYTQQAFEREFSGPFVIQACRPVRDSLRLIYRMVRKDE